MAARRLSRIKEKHGWLHGILNEEDAKPLGMHWRTY